MLKSLTVAACLTAGLALAGCSDSRGDRVLSDSAVGAGGGALLGAVAGFNPLVGAAGGAVAGAAVGSSR
jgi:hypothetical protein